MFDKIISELRISENQQNWFEYGKSHLAHMVLGACSAGIAAYAYFLGVGEYPNKIALCTAVMFFWAAYELITQWNARGFGNFEDWVFLSVWGAGTPILATSEITIGSSHLIVDLDDAWKILTLPTAHLIVGIIVRLCKEGPHGGGT